MHGRTGRSCSPGTIPGARWRSVCAREMQAGPRRWGTPAMGKVTDHLVSLIKKQVQDHGVVVWYDPERAYINFAPTLDLPGTTVVAFTRAFFALRELIEPHLEFVRSDGRPRAEAGSPPK